MPDASAADASHFAEPLLGNILLNALCFKVFADADAYDI